MLRSTGSSPAYVEGYLVLEGAHIIYADGAKGLEKLKNALDTRDEGRSYLDRLGSGASFYLLSKGGKLSVSYSTLPSGIKDVTTVSKSISYDGKTVTLRCVYSFNDTDTAIRNLPNIKALDFQGNEFAIYDNFIVTVTDYREDSLFSLLRSM